MNGKLLFLGVSILIFSVVYLTFLAMPNYQIYPLNQRPLLGAQPSTIPTIAFYADFSTAGLNYQAHKIIFDVNGTYEFGQDAWLKISDTSGKVVYDFPIRSLMSQNYVNGTVSNSFPINIYLENTGEYVAIFQDVSFGNGTCLTAYSVYTEPIARSSLELNFFYLLVVMGLMAFSTGWAFTIYNFKKITKKCDESVFFTKEEELTYSDINVLFSVVEIFLLFMVSYLVLDIFDLGIWMKTAIMSLLGFLFMTHGFFSIKKQRNLFKLSYEKLSSIEQQATNYVLISSILLIFSLCLFMMELFTDNLFFVAIGFYMYIVATVIFMVTAPFFSFFTEKGKRVLPLRKFINSYEKDPYNTDFNLLAIASRRICKYLRFSELQISSSTLTVGLCNYVLTNKSTSKIKSLLEQLEKEKPDSAILMSLLKELISEGDALEEINIRNVPSFIEQHSRELGYLSSLLVGVMTILAILNYLHFF